MKYFLFYSVILFNIFISNAILNIFPNDTIILIVKKDILFNYNYFNFVLLTNSTLFRKNIEERVIKKSSNPSTLRLLVPEEDINRKFLHSINYKNNFKIMTYISNSDLNIHKFIYLFRNKNVKFIFFITNVKQHVEIFRQLFKDIKIPFSILNLNRINNYNLNTRDREKVSLYLYIFMKAIECLFLSQKFEFSDRSQYPYPQIYMFKNFH
jgi:hypothetical protein